MAKKQWADSMECCYLRNVLNLVSDEKTPYERRFGDISVGKSSLFGSVEEHHLISSKDHARLQQFGKKVLPSICTGYALYVGAIWKEMSSLQTLRNCNIRTRQKFMLEYSTQTNLSCLNTEKTLNSREQMVRFRWQVKIKKPQHPSILGDRSHQGEEHHDFHGEA